MEILRFEEATTTAPKRKKSSKGYLTLGFVAALFSVGSAFATSTSSININDNEAIALGQGISTFTTCDSKIAVIPGTVLKTDLSTFAFEKVTIGASFGAGSAADDFKIDNRTQALGGCLGVDFIVKFYSSKNSPANVPVDICTAGVGGGSNPTVTGSTSFKCFTTTDNQRMIFEIKDQTHDITFNRTLGTDYFDRISIETTSGTDYR